EAGEGGWFAQWLAVHESERVAKPADLPGQARAHVRLARKEGARLERTLHEKTGARRFDQLVAERRIHDAAGQFDNCGTGGRLSTAPQNGRLGVPKRERLTAGGITVDLHHQRAVLPVAGDLHATAADQEPVLVHGSAARAKLVLRLLVIFELRLHVARQD